MRPRATDLISPREVASLPELFLERVRRTPTACAYRRFHFEGSCCAEKSWEEMLVQVSRWQDALRREGLQPGDRVAIMLRNGFEWVAFDLAALGLGLVTVPLFVNDRPDNFAYIIEATESRLLLIDGVEHWQGITTIHSRLGGLKRIVSVKPACERDCDPRLIHFEEWLPETAPPYTTVVTSPEALASIVYTSGTTGNPKGVMLTHANILENAYAGACAVPVYPDDVFLSFLPLSHTLERTVGYYIPIMAGACVAYVRSLEQLAEDLREIRPTMIVSVPRVFERVHQRITTKLADGPRWKRRLFARAVATGWQRFLIAQGRASWSPAQLLWPLLDRLVARPVRMALGGRLRLAISGGAPLDPGTARDFIALGVNILQGYGLTETSPVVSVNLESDNYPETVGVCLPGVEVQLGDHDELLVRGPGVMAGYWQDPAATTAVIDGEGWLHTGDQARIDADGHIVITGRLKEILVLATGEKAPPADMEAAIVGDPLFEQVMVVGEGRPFLAALVVLSVTAWQRQASALGIAPQAPDALADPRVETMLCERIGRRLHDFPGYAQVRRVHASLAPWTVEDGLLTATMKLRRAQVLERYRAEIDRLYAGH